MLLDLSEVKPRSRRDTLSFMVALATAAGFRREADGYMLELLAAVAFNDPENAQAVL